MEVHPGAVIGTRLSPKDLDYVLAYKNEKGLEARKALLKWLEQQHLIGIPEKAAEQSHSLDACAAVLGAWHWKNPAFTPKWISPAKPPLHPFDYCC